MLLMPCGNVGRQWRPTSRLMETKQCGKSRGKDGPSQNGRYSRSRASPTAVGFESKRVGYLRRTRSSLLVLDFDFVDDLRHVGSRSDNLFDHGALRLRIHVALQSDHA